MTDEKSESRYVLIGRNKQTGEEEPIHPGSVDKAEAKRVSAELMMLHGIRVEVWDADEWERHMMEEQADLFCDCGMMKEDCRGHLYDVHVQANTIFTVTPRAHSIDEAIEFAEAREDEEGPLDIHGEETDGDEAVSVWDGETRQELSVKDADDNWSHKTPAKPAAGDIEWADHLDELHAQEQERLSDIDRETDEDAYWDNVLPDLTQQETQDAALELLELLQGHDFGHGSGNIYVVRMLQAIGNKLHDEWTPLTKRPTVIESADADDWLHLQRDGFDVFHGTRIFHDAEDLDGRPSPDLSDDEYQQLIDVICKALEV